MTGVEYYYKVGVSGMLVPASLYTAVDTARGGSVEYYPIVHARQLVARYGADHVFESPRTPHPDDLWLLPIHTHTLTTLAAACGCRPEMVRELQRLGSPWTLRTPHGHDVCPLSMPSDNIFNGVVWMDQVRHLVACGFPIDTPLIDGLTILARAAVEMRSVSDLRTLVCELGGDIGAACVVQHCKWGQTLAPAFLAGLCVASRDAYSMLIQQTVILTLLRMRPWPVDALWGDKVMCMLVAELRTYPPELQRALGRFLRPQQMRAYCVAMRDATCIPTEICNMVYSMTE